MQYNAEHQHNKEGVLMKSAKLKVLLCLVVALMV